MNPLAGHSLDDEVSALVDGADLLGVGLGDELTLIQ